MSKTNWLGIAALWSGVGAIALLSSSSSPTSTRPTGLAYGQKFTPEERAKILQIGEDLQIDPSFLTAIMTAESGRDHQIHITPVGKDSRGGAIYKRSSNPDDITDKTIGGGLIGFMRQTARGLDTNLWDLLHLSRLDQLDYLRKFYAGHRKSGVLPPNPSLWRVYMSTFYPALSHLADSPKAILFSTTVRKKPYFANIAADRDKDGDIEIEEAMARIGPILKKGYKKGNVF